MEMLLARRRPRRLGGWGQQRCVVAARATTLLVMMIAMCFVSAVFGASTATHGLQSSHYLDRREDCACPSSIEVVLWSTTPCGETAAFLCPSARDVGSITRPCFDNGTWGGIHEQCAQPTHQGLLDLSLQLDDVNPVQFTSVYSYLVLYRLNDWDAETGTLSLDERILRYNVFAEVCANLLSAGIIHRARRDAIEGVLVFIDTSLQQEFFEVANAIKAAARDAEGSTTSHPPPVLPWTQEHLHPAALRLRFLSLSFPASSGGIHSAGGVGYEYVKLLASADFPRSVQAIVRSDVAISLNASVVPNAEALAALAGPPVALIQRRSLPTLFQETYLSQNASFASEIRADPPSYTLARDQATRAVLRALERNISTAHLVINPFPPQLHPVATLGSTGTQQELTPSRVNGRLVVYMAVPADMDPSSAGLRSDAKITQQSTVSSADSLPNDATLCMRLVSEAPPTWSADGCRTSELPADGANGEEGDDVLLQTLPLLPWTLATVCACATPVGTIAAIPLVRNDTLAAFLASAESDPALSITLAGSVIFWVAFAFAVITASAILLLVVVLKRARAFDRRQLWDVEGLGLNLAAAILTIILGEGETSLGTPFGTPLCVAYFAYASLLWLLLFAHDVYSSYNFTPALSFAQHVQLSQLSPLMLIAIHAGLGFGVTDSLHEVRPGAFWFHSSAHVAVAALGAAFALLALLYWGCKAHAAQFSDQDMDDDARRKRDLDVDDAVFENVADEDVFVLVALAVLLVLSCAGMWAWIFPPGGLTSSTSSGASSDDTFHIITAIGFLLLSLLYMVSQLLWNAEIKAHLFCRSSSYYVDDDADYYYSDTYSVASYYSDTYEDYGDDMDVLSSKQSAQQQLVTNADVANTAPAKILTNRRKPTAQSQQQRDRPLSGTKKSPSSIQAGPDTLSNKKRANVSATQRKLQLSAHMYDDAEDEGGQGREEVTASSNRPLARLLDFTKIEDAKEGAGKRRKGKKAQQKGGEKIQLQEMLGQIRSASDSGAPETTSSRLISSSTSSKAADAIPDADAGDPRIALHKTSSGASPLQRSLLARDMSVSGQRHRTQSTSGFRERLGSLVILPHTSKMREERKHRRLSRVAKLRMVRSGNPELDHVTNSFTQRSPSRPLVPRRHTLSDGNKLRETAFSSSTTPANHRNSREQDTLREGMPQQRGRSSTVAVATRARPSMYSSKERHFEGEEQKFHPPPRTSFSRQGSAQGAALTLTLEHAPPHHDNDQAGRHDGTATDGSDDGHDTIADGEHGNNNESET